MTAGPGRAPVRACMAMLVVYLAVFVGVQGSPAAAVDTGSISGTVTVAGAAPTARILVLLTTPTGSAVKSVTTETGGRFDLADVPTGSYRIKFTGQTIMTTWYGGEEDLATAAPVGVDTAGSTDASADLEPAGRVTGNLSQGATRPYGTITMWTQDASSTWASGTSAEVTANAPFTIFINTRQPFRLSATTRSGTFTYWYGDTYSVDHATTIQLSPGQILGSVDIDVPATATVVGKATNAFGGPISARVSAYVLDHGTAVQLGNIKSIGNTGFSLTLPAGHVTLAADPGTSDLFQTTWLGGATAAEGASYLDLSVGETRYGQDIPVEGGRTYRGRATDANGVGISDVEVTAFQGDIAYSRATTDADGNFGLPHLGYSAMGGVHVRFTKPNVITEWYRDAADQATSGLVYNYPIGTDVSNINATLGYDADHRITALSDPTLTGDFTPGGTVTVSPAQWSIEPDRREFRWFCDGQPLGLTGQTIMVVWECQYTVREFAIKNGYESGMVESAAERVIRLAATSAPQISGTPMRGHTLVVSTPTWNATPADVRWHWNRDGLPIVGPSSTSYTLTLSDVGHRISATAEAMGRNGYGNVTSPETPIVRAQPGLTLTATPRRGAVTLSGRLTTPGATRPGGRVTLQIGSRVVKTANVTRAPLVIGLSRPIRRGWHSARLTFSGSAMADPLAKRVRFHVR